MPVCQHCCAEENGLGDFGWEHLHCIGYTSTTEVMSNQNHLFGVTKDFKVRCKWFSIL
uniref:Uncharacterized protein n=1 Tax=Arundo donax TaxID=35708 RepID=A0A0A9G6C5_ARUDO